MRGATSRHWLMGIDSEPIDQQKLHQETERVRNDLHQLVARAGPGDLRRRTDGTRWTNTQLLWHMAFGFLVVRRLLQLGASLRAAT